MPLLIEDAVTETLVATLARRRGLTPEAAVRQAVAAELARDAGTPLRERLAALRDAHPLPPPTGLKADKAFFDWLNGEEEV